MPNGLPQAGQIAGQTADVDQVRMVCNAYGRCWHRPNSDRFRLQFLNELPIGRRVDQRRQLAEEAIDTALRFGDSPPVLLDA